MQCFRVSPSVFDLIIGQNENSSENTSQVVRYTQEMFRTGFLDAFTKFKPDSPVHRFVRASCATCSFHIQPSQEEHTRFTLTKRAVSIDGQEAEQSFSFIVEQENERFWIKRTDRPVLFSSIGAFFRYFLVLDIFEKTAKLPVVEDSLEALKARLISHETLSDVRW